MHISVTVLGSNGGLSPEVIGRRIADYLESGRTRAVGGQKPRELVELPVWSGAVAYYADSAGLRPGRWALGHTTQDRSGDVDSSELATLLAGTDPRTGEPLISSSGSAGRALRQRGEPLSAVDLGRERYSVGEAAELLGISASYLRKVLVREELAGSVDDSGISVDQRGRKLLSKELVLAIAENRKPPRVVAGYDLTFSPVKSISVLWAGGDEVARTEILDALDESVAAGLRYFERNALSVRVKGRSELASGLIAADYLHTTSRALEPQLHHHVVIANVGIGPDGVARALDSRMIFHHAKTASFLAAAELRFQLSTRLGVTWTESVNGISEIEGIPTAAVTEMSSRARDIAKATSELGLTSPKARQIASWDTRAAKTHGVEQAALFVSWDERLEAAGYGPGDRDRVLGRVEGPESFTPEMKEHLFAELLRSDGITEHTAIFDRRVVIQRLAERIGDWMAADAIDDLADELLARPEVVELERAEKGSEITRSVITRDDRQSVSISADPLYSTEAMLALEQRALSSYQRGWAAATFLIERELIDAVLSRTEFAYLSDEQRAFVASLTGSSMRIQAGVGAAGSGKTTALKAAVAVWQEAGYKVLGAAVGGTQAVVLSEETGIEAKTVASILARYFGHDDLSIADDRTVLLVDEASLLSTKDFAALARITEEQGALLRIIGDPAQHSSVNAGGIFRHITEHHPDETPALTHLYRQQGEAMEQVRLANAEYREGQISKALERLAQDGRITEANSAEEAYDLLTCAWYVERQKRIDDPDRRRSAMTAEHHVERRELNVRARVLLTTDGTLGGAELRVGELVFQAGDEVIARVVDRTLRVDGAERDAYIRNGSLGTVASVCKDSLIVDFERWGRIEVPMSYLTQKLPSGVIGGLQHAYALTTHAAQGETFAIATPLVTDGSSTEGVYVGITRGQFDLQAVVVRQRDLAVALIDDDLPVLQEDTGAMRAMERRLEHSDRELLASELTRVSRIGDPVDREASFQRRSRDSAEVQLYEAMGDDDVMDKAQSMQRELQLVGGEMIRLEQLHDRRQSLMNMSQAQGSVLSVVDEANAGTQERLIHLKTRMRETESMLQIIDEEIERRGIARPQLSMVKSEMSSPTDEELWTAGEATAMSNLPGPVMQP